MQLTLNEKYFKMFLPWDLLISWDEVSIFSRRYSIMLCSGLIRTADPVSSCIQLRIKSELRKLPVNQPMSNQSDEKCCYKTIAISKLLGWANRQDGPFYRLQRLRKLSIIVGSMINSLLTTFQMQSARLLIERKFAGVHAAIHLQIHPEFANS